MTGLEMLLNHIHEEALETEKGIVNDAKAKAQEIKKQGEIDAQKNYNKLMVEGKEKVELYRKRAESSALLQKKKRVLEAKQALIEEVFLHSKATLLELPDEIYFETILKMLPSYAKARQGEIAFTKKDLARMPQAFEEKINASIQSVEGAYLKISPMPRNIEGGFILIYEDIEENCSFEALLLENKENLQDKVCSVLFPSRQAY